MAGEVRTRTYDELQLTVLETVALAAMRLPYINEVFRVTAHSHALSLPISPIAIWGYDL